MLLQLLAWGDVGQGPTTAEHGADKGPVGSSEGKPQLDQAPLDGELQQALLGPAEHHRQRHRPIQRGRLVRLAILTQQLHIGRITGAIGVIELAGSGLIAHCLDPPELGQVHLVRQLGELSFDLAPLRRLHRFAGGGRGQGHFIALEAHPHHPLAVEDGSGANGWHRRQSEGIARLAL
ncbi:hypothetical protein D3C76_906640 [compost metagenome]